MTAQTDRPNTALECRNRIIRHVGEGDIEPVGERLLACVRNRVLRCFPSVLHSRRAIDVNFAIMR